MEMTNYTYIFHTSKYVPETSVSYSVHLDSWKALENNGGKSSFSCCPAVAGK